MPKATVKRWEAILLKKGSENEAYWGECHCWESNKFESSQTEKWSIQQMKQKA